MSKQAVDPKSHVVLSHEYEEAKICTFPKEPLQRAGLNVDNATFAQISGRSRRLYKALLQYATEVCNAIEQIYNNPEDSDSDSDDGEEGDKDHEDEAFLINNFETAVLSSGIRKGKAPCKPRFGLGLGVATALHKERKVYFLHYAIPNSPVKVQHNIDIFRELVIATEGCGKETYTFLQDFCWIAKRWHTAKEERLRRAGKYVLFQLRTDRECSLVHWMSRGCQIGRPLDKIFLPAKIKQSFSDDIEHFLSPKTKQWYLSNGLPYRRAYLFYGPPGTGKTSMIRSCAGKYRFNLAFFALTNRNFSNQTLNEAFQWLPNNCAIVIEDFDTLFLERENKEAGELTFSGLLNALDGLCSRDQTLIFMTTNQIEKMDRQDPALLRAGRVDRRFKFDLPTPEIIQEMFQSFYPDASLELAQKFSRAVFDRPEEESTSIATLQELFIYCEGKNSEKCVSSIGEFFDTFYPDKKTRSTLYV